jgi:hypothetical protein
MKKTTIYCFFLLSVMTMYGQIDPPDDEDGDGEIPIDGFISLIIGLGGAYSYKLIRKNKNS